MPVYVAQPKTAGRYPAVILMHERYGLVQHTEDLARRCAEDGFVVCAPNFFFRHPDQRALNAGDSRYDLTDPELVQLLSSALALLERERCADLDKIAVAGFCQTGRHPLVFAAERADQRGGGVVWRSEPARMGSDIRAAAGIRRDCCRGRLPGIWRFRLGRPSDFDWGCLPISQRTGEAQQAL